MENKTTSKLITWIFITYFLVAIIMVGAIDLIFKTNLSYLLNYLSPIMGIIVVSYYGKSGMENYVKIKSNTDNLVNQDYTNVINNTDTNNQSNQSQG